MIYCLILYYEKSVETLCSFELLCSVDLNANKKSDGQAKASRGKFGLLGRAICQLEIYTIQRID